MELGVFMMPSHPPERSLYDASEWNLQVIRWAEQLGFAEAWIGEHFTAPWEPIPSPDLLIAQALKQTRRIKLAAGAHLLPYHHPIELAYRVAYLDHLSQGRLMLGVGTGGLESDAMLFDVNMKEGENKKRTAEALEIILKLWTSEEPFEFKGNFWNVGRLDHLYHLFSRHIRPLQQPHPPIGIAGLSKGSKTLEFAGARGFMPMSLGGRKEFIASHWEAVEIGATKAGRSANRSDWKITREIFVAPTDEEALSGAVNGTMGRQWREYWWPLHKATNMLHNFKADPDHKDEDVTAEYVAEHIWIVGSPDTVTRKLNEFYATVGGYGTLLLLSYDYIDKPELWRRSMELLANEVLPKLEKAVTVL